MRVLGGLILVAALAGCATPCPNAPATPTAQGFECADGSTLQVTFSQAPDAATIAQDGFPTLTLPRASTGSGYRYAADGSDLRGRGDEARWQRPGSAETVCREVR